jgi:hypothetical protein
MKRKADTFEQLSEAVSALDNEVSSLGELADIEQIFDAIVEGLIATKLVQDEPYDLREVVDDLCDRELIGYDCLQATDDLIEINESTAYQDHQETAAAIKTANAALRTLYVELIKLVPRTTDQ